MSTPSTPDTPLYTHVADSKTPEEWQAILDRLHETQRRSVEHASAVSAAWSSAEARAIAEVVRGDGNVDWREFVSHAGGILEVVKLVDDQGKPDTRRIIPLVDELFDKYARQEFRGGVTFTKLPNNRPYPHARPVVQAPVVFPEDGAEAAAELLREEQEQAARRPTTHPR